MANGSAGTASTNGGGGGRTKIRITGLCKSFGPKRVLDGIDLEVQTGESLVIIGASGSG